MTAAIASLLLLLAIAAVAVRNWTEPLPRAAAPAAASPRSNTASVSRLESEVAQRPDDVSSWLALAHAYLGRLIETNDASYGGLAQRATEQAARIAPSDPRVLVSRGVLALSRHDFAGAGDLGRQAEAVAPDAAEPRLVQIDSLIELGRYDDAARTTEALLALRPSSAAYARVSYLRELSGDTAGALDAMATAEAGATRGSDLATVAALHGDVLLRSGDVVGARAAYERARREVPAHPAAVLGLARIELASGDPVGATALLTQLVDRTPTVAAVRLLAAVDGGGRAELDDLAGHLLDLQQAGGVDVSLERADLTGDLVSAETAMARRPTVGASATLGWALHLAGRDREAAARFDDALRFGWRDPVVRARAGVVFTAVGDVGRARQELDVARAAGAGFPYEHQADAMALAAALGTSW